MIDTHCHLYHEYYKDLDSEIANVKKAGVTKVIINGCDMNSNLEVLELVKKYDIVYGAIGFHPTEEHDNIIECMKFLKEHINDEKIVAIGEIGLDYHYDNTDKESQLILFEKQLELASEYNKPVIVHTRDSAKDTYDILSKYNLHGSIHAYSGSVEMAYKFVKLGYCLGIGGVCTFKNARNIIEVINEIDLSYLLLETDAPYLAPVPYRGQTNTSAYLPIIANKIGEIKHISDSDVINKTTNNASRLFDF